MRRVLVLGVLVLGVAGFYPRLDPPAGAGFTRGASNPIISPTLTDEATAVYEPDVILDPVIGWRMWYGGGWGSAGIFYATCAPGLDPSVPGNWVKHGLVLGLGASGVAGSAYRNEIVQPGGPGTTLHLFYADANPTGNIKHATSSDGIAWTVTGTAISNSAVGGITGWQNSTVVPLGTTWHMLVDGYTGSIFTLFYFKSTDSGSTWSVQHSGTALSSLQVHSGGTYGSPDLHKQGATWVVWFLAVNGTGNLPTDIYRSTSTDLLSWTTPVIVLTHTGSGFEVDQVADPNVTIAGSTAYLFYAGMDNGSSAGHIGIATGPASP